MNTTTQPGVQSRKQSRGLQSVPEFIDLIRKITQNTDITEESLRKFDIDLLELNTWVTELYEKSITSTNQIERIDYKMQKLKDRINRIVKAHSFNEDVLPVPEILEITKQDDYKSELLIYNGFIEHHKEISKQMELLSSETEFDLFVLTTLNSSIETMITDTEKFNENILTKVDLIVEINEDELYGKNVQYDPDELVLIDTNLTGEIYNYADRLNYDNSIDAIKPLKAFKFTEILDSMLASTQIDSRTIPQTTSILDRFDINKLFRDIKEPKVSRTVTGRQAGGADEILNSIETQVKLYNNFSKLSESVNECNKSLELYHQKLFKIKLHEMQKNNYFLYLLLVNTPTNVKNTMVYRYLNQGLLQFYLTIIDIILDQIHAGTTKPEIIYFYQNHYVILNKLKYFLEFAIKEIKKRNLVTSGVVNIQKCTGKAENCLFLLNCFKDILDSFHEILQSKVSIYLRINDWGQIPKTKVFNESETNARMLNLNRRICNYSGTGINEIKFTEVFGKQFSRNEQITKYMTLETQLSKKKGVMLMTYGYSGTGKTFTLFGSSGVNKKQGILQATLNNINGLEEVKIRVFELYGKAVQYPHYWQSHDIYQYIIEHKLKINEGKVSILGQKNINNITGYLSNLNRGFITIKEKDVTKVFSNFETFISELDDSRRNDERIKITSNNPESSRSIVIYELLLLIEKTYVPFVIIDLPGREEIIQTYCDNYFSKISELSRTNDRFNNPFSRAVLTSLCINPLALSILTPSTIFNTYNNSLGYEKRAQIVDTPMLIDGTDSSATSIQNIDDGTIVYDEMFTDDSGNELEIDDQLDYDPNDMVYIGDDINGVPFELEHFTTTYSKRSIVGVRQTLSYIYNFNTKLWERNKLFNMVNDKVQIRTRPMPRSKYQIPTEISTVQYEGALAIHLMNRLIIQKQFNVLETIYKNVMETYFPKFGQRYSTEEKLGFLSHNFNRDFIEEIKLNIKKVDFIFDQSYNFKSFSAPSEGIYINENIVGLIKVLARDILKKDDTFIKRNLMGIQDESLKFNVQKAKIRQFNYDLYKEAFNYGQSARYIRHDDDVVKDVNVLEQITENNKTMYSSQNIYNYDSPSIGEIMNIYRRKRTSKKLNMSVEEVTDFKVFYLVTNTQQEKKCEHQLKLLDGTLQFIYACDDTMK